MAANGGVTPGAAKRTGDAIAVEIGSDGARALAGGELTEDAAHDDSLRFIDVALSAHLFAFAAETLDHVIAVAEAAAGLALLDSAAHAALGLGGKILHNQGVHLHLEADMTLGSLAFRLGDEPHLHKPSII